MECEWFGGSIKWNGLNVWLSAKRLMMKRVRSTAGKLLATILTIVPIEYCVRFRARFARNI